MRLFTSSVAFRAKTVPVTPIRPKLDRKSPSSSSSSISSRIFGKAFNDTPQIRDFDLSPISSPDEPASKYGVTRQLPFSSKLAGSLKGISGPKSDYGPTKSRGIVEIDGTNTISSDEESVEDDRESPSIAGLPDPCQSFSTKSSRGSPIVTTEIRTNSESSYSPKVFQIPPRETRQRSESENESDEYSEEESRASPIEARPKFRLLRSKGVCRPSKERRSINFEILDCPVTASKKKKKEKPDARLGSIYVFESPEQSSYHLKVGKSNRDPVKRETELEKCGIALVEVGDVDRNCFDHYDIMEAFLHVELQNFRRAYKCTACGRQHSEWFESDKWTVLEVVNRWPTWIKEKEPFDESWEVTAYWQWRVGRAKVFVNDLKWADWSRSSMVIYFTMNS
ncbi:uncharacterized protein RAG0_10685 [Rhynchosporium agropyri]|uniref:Bacteriophage T5 Orf172 DNA-binding domain-containing protein n=1 Tax=Rhynchosporium agropyri TaxID=914238 RepID=A0A1E1L0T6_9HELO|nr:uncharacterized protein RAG0_10685 [Rhynchosporium agropyri]